MLKNRYFAQSAIIAISGIILGVINPLGKFYLIIPLVIGLITLIANFIIFKIKKTHIKTFFYISLISVYLVSFVYSSFCCTKYSSDELLSKEQINIEAVIIEDNSKHIDIETLSGDISKGTKIRIYNLEDKTDSKNEIHSNKSFYKGEFNLKLTPCPNYVKAEGISFYGNGSILSIDEYKGKYFKKAAFKARNFFDTQISKHFAESDITSAFLKAVILGETSEISDEVYSYYGRLGITHIIAVSGLHFSIIIMTFFNILSRIGFYRKTRCVICIIFSLFYCFFSGSSPSSVRAMIMIIFFLVAKFFLFKVDSFSSLCVAAIIILFLNPYSIYSISFILSFLATFALSITPRFFDIIDIYHEPKLFKITNKLVQNIFITLMISIFIMPVLYYRFQTFSLITPLANIFLSIVFPLLMYVSLIAVILSPIDLPEIFTKIVCEIVELFHRLIEKIASIKGISIVPKEKLVYLIFFFIFLCIVFALFFKKKKRSILIKLTTLFFIISVSISVIENNYIIKNYDRIIFSENGSSALVFYSGNIYYIAENETSIDNDFIISNNILDIDSLIVNNISKNDNVSKKVSDFHIKYRPNEIFIKNDTLTTFEDNVYSKETFSSEFIDISIDYGINIAFENQTVILWLGDNARENNKIENVDKVVLTDSFFNKNANVRSIPQSVKEFYIPEGHENSYALKFISINFPESSVYNISEFEYKVKN